jgi:hypothetical protein
VGAGNAVSAVVLTLVLQLGCCSVAWMSVIWATRPHGVSTAGAMRPARITAVVWGTEWVEVGVLSEITVEP